MHFKHRTHSTWVGSDLKAFPPRISFHGTKRTMQASKGGSSQQACLAMVPMKHRNSGMHPMVATNSSLIGLRACWGVGNPPTTLGCWSHGLEKPTAIILLEQHSPELHSNISYLQINVVLTPYQRNFSWQQMQTITENHNQSKCEEQETVVPGPNLYICTQLLHPRLGDHFGRGGQMILKARGTKSLLSDCVS